MNSRVQWGVTAGVAIVGASVMAVAPLSVPMSIAQENPQLTADITLAATVNPLEAAIILFEGLAQTGQNAAGAAALSPLSPAVAAIALAGGDNDLLYSVIRQSIDAPLWAADPTIDALAAVLPDPLGGGVADETPSTDDGLLIQFRDNVLWAATNAIRTPIGEALGAEEPDPNDNPVAILAEALGGSGQRLVEGAALAPLGLIPIAQAVAEGSEEDLYAAIRQYIDAPLWVADPILGTDPNAGPAGLTALLPDRADDIQDFRDDTLWAATNATRTAVANVLGVNPNLPNSSLARGAGTADKDSRVLGSVNLGKFAPASNIGSGTTLAGDETDNPMPVRAAVKAINDQVKASAERIDRTVKKIAGVDGKDPDGTG